MTLENAVDGTLIAVVPTPSVRVAVAESLNRELGKANKWRDCETIRLIVSSARLIGGVIVRL